MATFIENNQGANNGWLYYKDYYNGRQDDSAKIIRINNLLSRSQILGITNNVFNQLFTEITTYPGLIIGTGYTHEYKASDDAFKIGFFFDHSSGIPIIPGSSVKGLLRSVFPQRVVVPEKETANQAEKERWIKEILKEQCKIEEEVDIDELEREIFDGSRKVPDKNNPEQIVIKPVPIYERDIFFDAVPIEITANNIGHEKRFLGSDYITPHKNKDGKAELDPFSNPTPLKFLKIMPKIKIEFRFKLEDSIVLPALNAENKRKLFQEIIKTIGVGAKTNVGYGQFE
jgi:CRISPR-associated protein Cmr6